MHIDKVYSLIGLLTSFGSELGVYDGMPKIISDIPGDVPIISHPEGVEVENGLGIYDKRRPVVIWHGLGDSYNGSSIHRTEDIINQIHPEVFVYAVGLDENPSNDKQASFIGDLNRQLEQVCDQITAIEDLKDGFDAIGYSQGGLFLRGLLQRCKGAKIHNLITFGSPHMGVMDLPPCADSKDLVCKTKNQMLKKQIYYDVIQHQVVPAQYFRDPYDYETYLKHSNFLANINNEVVEEFNKEYVDRVKSLNKFIMVQFLEDDMVVPKESAHFADVDVDTGEVIPLRESRIYKSDFLGLKTLDSDHKLVFEEIHGLHMRIPETFLTNIVNDYLGSLV